LNRSRHRLADASTLDFGNCRLDRTSHQFFRDEDEVVLTGKEYRLLEYFLEHRGKALKRQGIMNHVWGSSILVTQRSVDRCVTTLRQKVESNPKAPAYIKTIRDVGYRFAG
jgi:DNA-binding response OmpR family regulator